VSDRSFLSELGRAFSGKRIDSFIFTTYCLFMIERDMEETEARVPVFTFV
jgi:hypothetical protein